MSALTRLQEDFQAYLLRHADGIQSHVVGTSRVPIEVRLGIYGDGYCLRLIEALQANYPALAKMMDDEFATLGTAYVRANDSHFPSIRYYGADLADFLNTDPEYSRAPVLAELARWEWTMTEVFDAADAAPIGVDALGRVPAESWATLRLNVHPSVRRLALFWNAPQIWKTLTDDVDRPKAAVRASPTQWLLWREGLQTYYRSLESPEAEAVSAASDGATFGEICTVLARHFTEDETPARAAGLLKRWVESGMITAVSSQ